MSDSPDQPEARVAGARKRGSGPILILAVLFLTATFLAWYFTWFGRELSDTDISRYLSDTRNPRHVQHALLQIQQRIERGDPNAKKWYPQLLSLSKSPETEFRLTVAWTMGFDNKSAEFHEALGTLLHDTEPIVRRNAALALVRFNDHSGREELLSILKPFDLKSPVAGSIASTLREGSEIARGSLLARIEQPGGKAMEVRSPLPGRINKIAVGNGSQVTKGEQILSINSDEESVWEALRALSLIGEPEDLTIINEYAGGNSSSERVREQARVAMQAIKNRVEQTQKSKP
jgi:hypothetical protein